MATNNWAKVYFQDQFAGILEEEPGGACSFTYDESFLRSSQIPISLNIGLDKEKHFNENGLHPFFDNLVAEGWLAEIQARSLSINSNNRFKLLMAFGHDLVGAVSVRDPDPQYKIKIDKENYLKEVTIKSKASMSGVQPKIFVRRVQGKYHPIHYDEASTHIAKLPGKYPLILENEYLCTLATQILLAPDEVVELELGEVEGIGYSLLVKRFDRDAKGHKIHFEELAQLLNIKSNDKYYADYSDMADFINESPLCSKLELEKLFRRILACILLGNTDAHLKNFAMFHSGGDLRLTPVYDMVFAAYYDELSSELALGLGHGMDASLGSIKAKHLRALCESFKLKQEVLELAVEEFSSKLDRLYEEINSTEAVSCGLKDALIKQVQKRWNGTFKNLGKK